MLSIIHIFLGYNCIAIPFALIGALIGLFEGCRFAEEKINTCEKRNPLFITSIVIGNATKGMVGGLMIGYFFPISMIRS